MALTIDRPGRRDRLRCNDWPWRRQRSHCLTKNLRGLRTADSVRGAQQPAGAAAELGTGVTSTGMGPFAPSELHLPAFRCGVAVALQRTSCSCTPVASPGSRGSASTTSTRGSVIAASAGDGGSDCGGGWCRVTGRS